MNGSINHGKHRQQTHWVPLEKNMTASAAGFEPQDSPMCPVVPVPVAGACKRGRAQDMLRWLQLRVPRMWTMPKCLKQMVNTNTKCPDPTNHCQCTRTASPSLASKLCMCDKETPVGIYKFWIGFVICLFFFSSTLEELQSSGCRSQFLVRSSKITPRGIVESHQGVRVKSRLSSKSSPDVCCGLPSD